MEAICPRQQRDTGENRMASKNVNSRVSNRMATYVDRLLTECQEKGERIRELESTTVSRERFDRAIGDIRRLRSQLDQAYSAGASAVLNSEVFNDYVPTSTRRNLRPGRFGAAAKRSTRG
jgi:hypothetical protein